MLNTKPQGIIGDGTGFGTVSRKPSTTSVAGRGLPGRAEEQEGGGRMSRRRGTGAIFGQIFAGSLVVAAAVGFRVGVGVPDQVQQQLDFVTLVADLQAGVTVFGYLADEVFEAPSLSDAGIV